METVLYITKRKYIKNWKSTDYSILRVFNHYTPKCVGRINILNSKKTCQYWQI